MHLSTKEYSHNIGLSCCFRQWRAQSHCRLLHGYALAVKFTFAAQELNENGWVMDFGGLKPLKAMLEHKFDHTLLVAEDDPHLYTFMGLQDLGLARVVVVSATGCERFAENIAGYTKLWLKENNYAPRVQLVSVEVKEHGANSAIFLNEPQYPQL